MGTIDETGYSEDPQVATMMDQAKRAAGTEQARAIRCIPDIPDPKLKDVVLLGDLFAKRRRRKPPKKINWPAYRPTIRQWLREGFSIRAVAAKLGVSEGAVRKANKQHDLYNLEGVRTASVTH